MNNSPQDGVPFWATESEEATNLFKLNVSLTKKVHERIAQMRKVSQSGHCFFFAKVH